MFCAIWKVLNDLSFVVSITIFVIDVTWSHENIARNSPGPVLGTCDFFLRMFQTNGSEGSEMGEDEPQQACLLLESRLTMNLWVVLDRKAEAGFLFFPCYLLTASCLNGGEIENGGYVNRKWGGWCLEWIIRNHSNWV